MSDEKIINYPLEIPFKDFMPGQVIQSGQFNDDMAEIEEKVNEVVEKHNTLTNETDNHVSNKDNPHGVTAKQVGTYSEEEIDTYLDDIRNGGLYDKSIENRVLDDDCVEARNIKNASITSIKVDSNFGSQINISKNIDITDRYTKKEVNDLLTQKVGEGTYSKEELDQMFEDVQAGQIVDGTIDVSKLKDNVGKNLDISVNPSITDRYTKAEVNVLIQENGLPRDWGGLDEIVQRQHYGELPIANVMTADEFITPLTPVLDIDVKEVVEARGEYPNLNERLNGVDSQLKKLETTEESTNISDRYVNINDFNNITEAIEYAKTNNKKILADKITLTENVNFRGVELEIDVLDIDKYSIELGGYYTPDVEGQAKTNPPQRINKILRDTNTPNGEEQVFIRGSVGQFITIGQYYGSVNFRMNETDTHNAYSTYTFGYVWKITIDNDTWVSPSPSIDLWMNENIFHINRCNHFIMKGTFPHDLNRIYGGCFEQNSSIEIYAGRHNYFYDMRFEGRKSVNVIFAEGTIGNVIYRNDLYYINIVDNGRQNAVIYKEQNNYRLINNYSIKADTFNTSYLNGFKNLIPTSDSLGFKPTSDGQVEVLETEFIPNPKNAMFTATCSRKVGNGLAVKYKIYDSSFKEITNLSSKQFFMVTTNESSMTNLQEGNYRSPGDQSANSKDCANGIFNDVVTLYPTSYFVSDGSNVKYVKFFIISSSYFNPGAEYYDMNANIYDISGNYHRYYTF